MQKRGQVSTEALFSLGIIVLFFGMMLVYSLERRQDVRRDEGFAARQADCFALSTAIVGLLENPGGSANVTLDSNATIRAASRVIEIDGDVPCRIPTSAVSDGTFAPGTLLLSSDRDGNVTVTHE